MIEIISSDIESTVNESVTLECISFGYPRPLLSWSHNRDILDENESLIKINAYFIDDITVGALLIRSYIRPKDAGTYSCVVVNTIGHTSKDVEVTVIGNWELCKYFLSKSFSHRTTMDNVHHFCDFCRCK